MQIDIHADDFPLADALRSHAEWRLRFALTYFDNYILWVVMRLSEIKRPRDGAHKRCHLQVVLAGLPDIVIEDTQNDLYVAINRATDRAGRTVERRLARQRDGVVAARLPDRPSIH